MVGKLEVALYKMNGVLHLWVDYKKICMHLRNTEAPLAHCLIIKIYYVVGFADFVDLWVIKIKQTMILRARSTSRSREQNTKCWSRSENVMTRLYDYQTRPTHFSYRGRCNLIHPFLIYLIFIKMVVRMFWNMQTTNKQQHQQTTKNPTQQATDNNTPIAELTALASQHGGSPSGFFWVFIWPRL